MTLAIGPLVGYLGFEIYCDGHDRLPAAVNQFTAADILICPSRKIYIFRGGRFKMPATVNRFTATGILKNIYFP